MNYTQRFNLRLAFFSMADKGGDLGTGGGPPKTLEQKLTDAETSAKSLGDQVTSLTKERDEAKSLATNLQAQFDELSKTANETKQKLATAESDLATTKRTLTGAQSALETEKKSVSRLETLCGVKGLDPKAAPPSLAEGEQGSGAPANVYDQWIKAVGAEKSKLWSEHRDAIRAEGERRAKAAQPR